MMKRNTILVAMFALLMLAIVDQGAPVVLRSEGVEFPDGSLQTTASAAASPRRFYLTDGYMFTGSLAPSACTETGFHMASIWEIADPTGLLYDASLPGAFTGGDLGGGPPVGLEGWVRSGQLALQHNVVGSNCLLWTTSQGAFYGTTARLTPAWVTGSALFPHWDPVPESCDSTNRVWCVEDW